MQRINIPKEQLAHMYLELGMSSCDIARELNCSTKPIYRSLKEYKIPTRNQIDSLNTPISLAKRSQLSRGKYHTEECKQRISHSLMGNTNAKGNKNRTGKHFTAEQREMLSQAALRRYRDPQERVKNSTALLKYYQDPNSRAKTGAAKRKFFQNNPEAKQKHTERINSPEARAKSVEAMKKTCSTLKYRAKQSAIQKKLWTNYTVEKQNNQIQAARRASNQRPNKVEIQLMDLLDVISPNEWKYVGNGEVIIGGLNPDFINIDGRKQIIELFGNYWHSKNVTGRSEKRETRLRENTYIKYGYTTLVIWENELKNQEEVLTKIIEFTGVPRKRRHG